MNVDIRLAKESEVSEIAIVKQKCWDTTYRGIYKDELIDNFDYKNSEDTFKSIINSEDSTLYVAIVDDKIVGFLCFGTPRYAFLDYEQELSMLYILEEYRGQGIGTMMFQLACSSIKMNGYDRFVVSANKYNEKARKFYLKMGAELVSEDPDMEDKRYAQAKYNVSI